MTACVGLALVATGLDAARHWRLLDTITGLPYLDRSLLPDSPALPEGCRSTVLQPFCLDSQWYVMHTVQLLRDGAMRVRSTRLDNAPFGRDVHWSSVLPRLAAATATCLAAQNGGSAAEHVTTAAILVPVIMHLFGAGLLLLVCWRAWGFPGAAAMAAMYLASKLIVDHFTPSDMDHHGLSETLAMGQIIAVQAGLWAGTRGGETASLEYRQPIAWWVVSGVFGGAALWINAQTALLALAASALALIVCLSVPPFGIRERLRPADLLAWGVSGGLVSMLLFCVEYLPAVWSRRLEVNHPLWALSWLGGATCLATFVGPRGQGLLASRPCLLLAARLASGLAAALPIVVVGLLRAEVFIPSDPFIYRLHIAAIREYEPLLTFYGKVEDTWTVLVSFLPQVCAAILTGCWLLVRGNDRGRIAVGVVFFGVAALVVQAASILQVRWQHLAAGIWAAYAAALIAGLLAANLSPLKRRMVCGTVLATMGAAVAPAMLRGTDAAVELRQAAANFSRGFAPTLILREIAHWLACDTAPRQPVVFTDPSTATELAFYGNCKVIGTLYWENAAGLKRTAMLFQEADEEAFRNALAAAGVTHIVIPSWAGLASAQAYDFDADGPDRGAREPSVVDRLVDGQEAPAWLEEVPTRLPEMFGMTRSRVKIYRVRSESMRSEPAPPP
jgi:hypothetical protein